MNSKININDIVFFHPNCCEFGIEGICKSCFWDWIECLCGRCNEPCGCGIIPTKEDLSYYEKIYRKSKHAEL